MITVFDSTRFKREVRTVRVSYKKLWKLLIDKEMNKRALARLAGISGSTLTKLTKGESVSMDILVRICAALECDLHDIVEIIPSPDTKQGDEYRG
jgi:DNA-binding Xre family transcriptional regulator